MSQKIGRNEPCPCGSGKKYKKCCLGRESKASRRTLVESRSPVSAPPSSAKFRMEPGSYCLDEDYHLPALANFRRKTGDWEYHFILVNPEKVVDEPQLAQVMALLHLENAFEEESGRNSEEIALFLRDEGYVDVGDFRLAAEEGEEGFTLYQTGDDKDFDYNPEARGALLEAIENQVSAGEPEEARKTFKRLMALGYSEEEARELMATVLAVELWEMGHDKREHDEERYAAALRRLPELPEGLEED